MGLSQTAYHFLGGLLKHARAYTAVCNPTVNSYKRLVPGYEAPVYVAWSGRNRSPLIRVPESRGLSTRLELRSVDPSANPYLTMAVLLQAGLDGIRNELTPPPAVDRNIYVMNEEERQHAQIEDLPSTLHNAIKELRKDQVMIDALGRHIFANFVEAKRMEWAAFRQTVSEWEENNIWSCTKKRALWLFFLFCFHRHECNRYFLWNVIKCFVTAYPIF